MRRQKPIAIDTTVAIGLRRPGPANSQLQGGYGTEVTVVIRPRKTS